MQIESHLPSAKIKTNVNKVLTAQRAEGLTATNAAGLKMGQCQDDDLGRFAHAVGKSLPSLRKNLIKTGLKIHPLTKALLTNFPYS